MAHKPTILTPASSQRPALPKIKAVHAYGSKILVEVLRADEIIGTRLHIGEKVEPDGAPQAYIVEVGPSVAENSGLKVGQRIYWTGKGTEVNDPRTTDGRLRALLEISNILAVIEEE